MPKDFGPPLQITRGLATVTVYQHPNGRDGRYQTNTIVWYIDGHRKRKSITNREEAVREAEVIADQLAADYHRTRSLTPERATYYRYLEKRLDGASLEKAIDHFVQSQKKKPAKKVLTENLVREYIRQRHDPTRQNVFARFGTVFAGQHIHLITSAEIEVFLKATWENPPTQTNAHNALNSFFSWARDNGYLPKGQITATEVVDSRWKPLDNVVLPPEQLALLLNEAPDSLRPAIALEAFAGLKMEKVRHITWQNIDWTKKTLALPGGKREIAMNGSLERWLRPYDVRDFNGRATTRLVEKSSGQEITDLAKRLNLDWRQATLQHSFIAYDSYLHGLTHALKVSGVTADAIKRAKLPKDATDGRLIDQALAEAWFAV